MFWVLICAALILFFGVARGFAGFWLLCSEVRVFRALCVVCRLIYMWDLFSRKARAEGSSHERIVRFAKVRFGYFASFVFRLFFCMGLDFLHF